MDNLENFEGLGEATYLRERTHPLPEDPFYLHLSDLLAALQSHASADSIRVLDLGCGGSPYRSLFPKAAYLRADIVAASHLDYHINSEGLTNAPDAYFDMVLSTQVLEHCPSPAVYLNECRRVLKKGGKLLLSTHGLFEEHGSPNDYHRWTDEGLRRAIASAGFEVISMTRLTLGPRAALQLLQRSVEKVSLDGRSLPVRLGWLLARRIILLRRRLWNPLADFLFPGYRLREGASLPGDNFYIAILAVARAI